MALLDDAVISLGAGVAVASLIILITLLTRYKKAVEDARKSSELAKNLWDAMNSRLTTQDARIVDLMVKFDIYSGRKTLPSSSVAAPKPAAQPSVAQTTQAPVTASQPISRVQAPQNSQVPVIQSVKATNETELTILRTLLEGPKMSGSIREVIQVTREHNARLLKGLYERGLVARSDQHKPFVYEITEAGRIFLGQS